MKKKILAVLTCAAIALSMTACANNNEEPSDSKSSKKSTTSSVADEPNDSNDNNSESSNSSSDSKPSEPDYPEASNVLYAQGEKLDFPETPLTDFDYEIIGNYAVIKEYFGKSSDVRIPETIDGKPIYIGGRTSSQSFSFNGNNAIKRLILPDGVYLYSGNKMDSVEMITFLGDVKFSDSYYFGLFGKDVSSIYFGGNIPERYQLENLFGSSKWYNTIADHNGIVVIDDTLICGHNCTGDVVVPKGVKKINDEAFVYVNAEKYLNGDALDIGFLGTPAKLTSVTLPDGLESIGNGAFCNTGLTSINIPDSVASISAFAFSETPYLKSIKNEDKLAIAGKWLIDGWDAYGHVTIPDGVTRIAPWALSGRVYYDPLGLQSITFPEGIEYIGDNAIRYTEFKEVTIPDNFKNLTYVGENGLWAFWDLDEYKDSEMLVFEKVAAIGQIKVKNSALNIPDGVKCVSVSYNISTSGGMNSYPLKSLILPDSICYYSDDLASCAEEITYKGKTYYTRGNNKVSERAALKAAIEGK